MPKTRSSSNRSPDSVREGSIRESSGRGTNRWPTAQSQSPSSVSSGHRDPSRSTRANPARLHQPLVDPERVVRGTQGTLDLDNLSSLIDQADVTLRESSKRTNAALHLLTTGIPTASHLDRGSQGTLASPIQMPPEIHQSDEQPRPFGLQASSSSRQDSVGGNFSRAQEQQAHH